MSSFGRNHQESELFVSYIKRACHQNEIIYHIFKLCEASGDDPEKVVEKIVTDIKNKLLNEKKAQRAKKLAEFEKLKKELGL